MVLLPEELAAWAAAADPEAAARARGLRLIAGVDEVGRGPLAGPVVAAAVLLPPGASVKGLKDSKQLTENQRENLARRIKEIALAIKVVAIRAAVIDVLGIQQASLLAMSRAAAALEPAPELILVDGPWPFPGAGPQLAVVKGDQRCSGIAAASVVAKVYRDGLMHLYHRRYPRYNFAAHKGYGTPEHLAALKLWGPCPLHRRTFRGVKEWCR